VECVGRLCACVVPPLHALTSTHRSFLLSPPPLPPHPLRSFECLPNNGTLSWKWSLDIGEFDVRFGAVPATASRAGASSFSFPAVPAKNFTWSATNGNVVSLRTSPTTLECYWMRVKGTGSKRQLVFVSLGGAAYDWQAQCDPAQYVALPNVETQPVCISPAGSRAPYKSTILGLVDYKGSSDTVQGSGAAASAAVGAAVSLGALAVAAHLVF
jgi:hypothetical protein